MPIIRLWLGKHKGIVSAMSERHNVYNRQKKHVFDCEQKGSVLVLAPKEKLPVGRLEKDEEKLQKAYDLGRECALEALESIKKFIST